ncbi:helix-turn-helix transcriptional regulator [Micromonospora zhanjiangensis]
MPVATSPTLRRRRLARELIRLREAAGLTIEQSANSAGISMSHLSRVERAHVGVRLPVVKVLLSTYGADAETVTYLIAVAREASQRGWWHQYVGSIPEQYATYIGFEAEASQVWSFDASTMPGLLQTEAYARAMFQGGAARFPEQEISRRVEVRLQRQAILAGADAPNLWIVMDEAVIRRQVGGPDTLRDQLDRIVEIAAQPHIDIQVLPFAVGAHPGTPGSFIVLSYTEPADPPVVYIETMAGDLYPERQDDITGAILAFDRLRAMALSPEDSIGLIRRAARELK